jgi:serine/threonine protein kinase
MNEYPLIRGAQLPGEDGRRYTIVEQIGRPGFRGIAYVATVEGDDNSAIVKLPNLDGNQNRMSIEEWVAETWDDFTREKKASDRLADSTIAHRVPRVRHLATARFRLASGNALQLPYIIRDKLDAPALDKWGEQIGRGAFTGIGDPALWRHVCADLAWLVAGIHELSIIHADIRPQNVRIGMSAEVLSTHIIDFGQSWLGVVRAAPNSVRHPYYSPERIMGPWDHRADIYSLGGVMFYAATGEIPVSPFADPQMDHRDRFRNDERVLLDRVTVRAKLRDALARRNAELLAMYPHVVDILADCMNPDATKRTGDARLVVATL